jgi:Flp pilus assembly protein TadG
MRGGERRPYGTFAGCERGASAVEFAFLAPVLILLVLGGIELADAFFLRSHMAEAARDAARRVAVGAMTTAEVPGFVRARLAGATDAEVRVTVTEAEGEFGTDVTVTAAVPLAELLPFTGGGGGTSRIGEEQPSVEDAPDGGDGAAAGDHPVAEAARRRAPRPSATGTTGATTTTDGAGATGGTAGDGGGSGPELSASATMLKER